MYDWKQSTCDSGSVVLLAPTAAHVKINRIIYYTYTAHLKTTDDGQSPVRQQQQWIRIQTAWE